MKILLIKIVSFITTLFSGIVYNFHKHIKGVKTKHNIKYVKKPNFYQRLDIHYPKDEVSKVKPCIIYFHGGGWTCYSKSIYTTLTRRLAKMGYVVFNVNYGLAPKYKMQEIINDCVDAIKFARMEASNYGGDPDKIVLAGDSAGAHLSSLIAGFINHKKLDLPELEGKIKALLLFYGVYNIETMRTTGFPRIKEYGEATLIGKNLDVHENEYFSPIKYVDDKFPPCLIASGKIDKLHHSQSRVLAHKLNENNVKTSILFFDKDEYKAVHAYMIFDGLSTNVQTLQKVESFLKEVL